MNIQLLRDLIGRFGQVRVLVVGDTMLDEYVTGDCTRLSPEAPIPVVRVRETRAVLGGAANTAANVAALGGAVTLVGARGNDDAGRHMARLLAQHGVSDACVDDVRPTSRKVRALGGQQQLLRLDYEDDSPASDAVASAALERVRACVSRASIVVLSDYAKGLVNPAFCRDLFGLARAAGVPVIVDPRPQHADCYVDCDYMTPNWKEALGLLGEVDGPLAEARVADVGQRLVTRFHSNVLLTLGAHGVRYFSRDGGEPIDEPAQAREVFDVSGAGDTVVAAFALGIAAGADVRSALRLANKAASIVVAKVGTATASAAELTRWTDGDRRFVAEEHVPALVRGLREAGRTPVVLTGVSGVIDATQMALFERSRRRGDVLIVGLSRSTADGSDDRVGVMLGLRDVEFVTVFGDLTDFLAAVGPVVHVDGAEAVAGSNDA